MKPPMVCFPACGTANQMQIILFKNEVISIDFDGMYTTAMHYKLTLYVVTKLKCNM